MFNIFRGIRKLMSEFLTNIDAAIDKIVVCHGAAVGADLSNLKTEIMAEVKTNTDALTSTLNAAQADLSAAQSSLATLQTSLTADEGVEASLVSRVHDLETALTHVVNHLANDNSTDAANAASAALAAPPTAPAPTEAEPVEDAPAEDAPVKETQTEDAPAPAAESAPESVSESSAKPSGKKSKKA